jgi:putative redox protein
MTSTIRVEHRGDDRFDVAIGRHMVRVDQPVGDGGEDSGPTPTELFVAGLASCVAHYARRFLHRHGLPTEGLSVTARFSMATDRPARVADISVEVGLPADVPEDRRGALLAVARHCTVHNSLDHPPRVRVGLEGSDVPESGAA